MDNMFKKLFTDVVLKVLLLLKLRTKKYPKKLYHKTRADFIERVKKYKQK